MSQDMNDSNYEGNTRLEGNDLDDSLWWTIPDPVLLTVLLQLKVQDVLRAGAVCKRWHQISHDNLLWRQLFLRDFKVGSIRLKPGAASWLAEYKRLTSNVPTVLTEILNAHGHQVLHVSFSHNGEMFATCSKDGTVLIWDCTNFPSKVKYTHNMKQFSWKYTQYSQFNQSDRLLMVSGVHFGSTFTTSGEIAVFSITPHGSYLQCRVVNRPYDIFGTWFSDQYLISGDLHWLAHLVSSSVLWLNKANQEVDSEHVPIMNQMYKFYNRNASSIRAVMVANCPWLEEGKDPLKEEHPTSDRDIPSNSTPSTSNDEHIPIAGNPISHTKLKNLRNEKSECRDTNASPDLTLSTAKSRYNPTTILYVDEFHKHFVEGGSTESNCDNIDEDEEQPGDAEEDDELENLVPKYLIFSTGAKTYTPHQIGIKRVDNVYFPKKLDPGPSLKERIAARRREREEQNNRPRVEPDWWNYEAVADRFDKVDKIIDLHGHIIGMALSPDHRYLYVNTRPWPKDYVISNPLEPPPIAQEIDIHVIDLMTMTQVGKMLRAHKAYTPNTECFFIFLNVCDNYVASGAEDQHAYLWDRYYGVCLAKYKHNDVVNSVAFNPRNNQMLVTTSDDFLIKVWRSRDLAKQVIAEPSNANHSNQII